jgi:hypothetical protein
MILRVLENAGWKNVVLRLALALAIVGFHLWAFSSASMHWTGTPFDREPGQPPRFADVSRAQGPGDPEHWNRLAVSRWDAQHYLGTAIRGFSQCPPEDLRGKPLEPYIALCDFKFYPAYSILGKMLTFGGKLPVDYALLFVSVMSSIATIFMWTSRAMVSALGIRATYLSLLLLGTFPSAFHLVSIHTEALLLAVAFGGFIALRNRAWLIAAIGAGGASLVHARGFGFSVGCGIAILVSFFTDPPRKTAEWIERALSVPISGWGGLAMAGYFFFRYRDPLLYAHAANTNRWAPALDPEGVAFLRSFDPPYAGVVLVAVSLLVLVGWRQTLFAFRPVERIYLVIATLVSIIPVLASRSGDYYGVNRYLLCVFPLFFAIAMVLRRSMAATGAWIAASLWHYWNVELCMYLGQNGAILCPCMRK